MNKVRSSNEVLALQEFTLDDKRGICTKYSVILWPPIRNHVDDVTTFIGDRFDILENNDYVLDDESFREFLWRVYGYDNTPKRRIKRKEKGISRSPVKVVRHLLLYVPNPDITLHKKKRLRGKPYSMVMKNLKRTIRKMFKKKIKRYVRDIIIHIGDDDEQTEFIANLLSEINDRESRSYRHIG